MQNNVEERPEGKKKTNRIGRQSLCEQKKVESATKIWDLRS
jgi:hypothetical protein